MESEELVLGRKDMEILKRRSCRIYGVLIEIQTQIQKVKVLNF